MIPDLNYEDILKEDIKQIQQQKQFLNGLADKESLITEVLLKISYYELIEPSSYRAMLYNRFGFGLNAYGAAQLAGFLELHNSMDVNQVSPQFLSDLKNTFNESLKQPSFLSKYSLEEQLTIFCAVVSSLIDKELTIPQALAPAFNIEINKFLT